MENFKAERSFSGLNMKQGKTTLLISGYDCCQLELYEIPEVRTYFEKLHQAWPCWSFFCDLRKTTLFWIAACLAQELGIFKTSKHSQIELQFPHAELLKFFEDTLPVAAKLHAKLGIAPGTGIQILWPVSLYLQIAGD